MQLRDKLRRLWVGLLSLSGYEEISSFGFEGFEEGFGLYTQSE
jgi:hypothetical protein